MDLRNRVPFFMNYASGYMDTVSGVSPLSLPKAKANSLQYVKAFGGTEQRDIPDNYLQRQYIYMQEGSYLLTDIVPTSDMRIELDIQTTSITTTGHAWLGARDGSAGSGLCVGSDGTKNLFFDGCSGTRYTSSTVATNNTRYKYTWNNGVATIESGGSVVATNTFTPSDTITVPFVINGLNSSGSVILNNNGVYCYGLKMWNAQGELVMDLVPAVQRGTVPVVGFYDTVSKTFKTATAGTFAAGGEAVPTPDAPMDIISNNGVLKARHQSGLPLGYTLLEYIESTGTQYIDTGEKITTDLRMNLTFQALATTVSSYYLGQYVDDFGEFYLYASAAGSVRFQTAWGCRWANTSKDADTNVHEINFYIQNNKSCVDIDNQRVLTAATLSTMPPYNILIAGTANSPALSSRTYGAKFYRTGALIKELVPAKNSSGVVGMYDTVTGTFFTNQGTGDFVAGSTVSDPVEIYTDGTVETINVHGKNLIPDVANSSSAIAFADCIPIKAGTYKLSAENNGADVYRVYITIRDANGNAFQSTVSPVAGTYYSSGRWQSAANLSVSSITRPNGITVTINEDCYLGIGYSNNTTGSLINWQLEQGSTATAYEPYFNGGTATAEMLLKVGDYQDVQSIIDGVVTRKIGIKVLDGTEDWAFVTGSTAPYSLGISDFDATAPSNRVNVISTHLQGIANSASWQNYDNKITSVGQTIRIGISAITTLADFKQYLADQYNAGTPVIIIYPLATPTTESVTGQTLQVQAGNNTLEITQASLNNLTLEAKYKRSK